ncbi:MAG TPA: FAD-dependent oxidoreductase [Miltoncostaeaceae bacterium]|nr:FAD-dependent oxidoreductase [Miltoncostaeaceae bacterium]
MAAPQRIVIVGGGLAGAKAAETLRGEGFDGDLTIVSAEGERPYERPPLSKEVLRGEKDREAARVHEPGFYEAEDIALRLGEAATALDPAARTVTLEGGDVLPWDRLLIATGAEPRPLPVPGGDPPGVLTLRTLADSDRLRDAARSGGRLVVIGAGWIGCEAAASARELGAEVTVVEMADVPLAGVLGARVGGIFAALHREHGVELLTGARLEAVEGDGRAERIRLAGGRTIDCAAVLAGVGVVPRTALAESAGLAVDDGILVDATLQTAAAGVFAAGDVANALHPFYGRRVRVEHWANALNQGPAAARNMLGAGAPYDRLPYFFSDQYDAGMEYSGLASAADGVVIRGDESARELIAFWVAEGRVLAGMNLNVWDVNDRVQELIRSRAVVDPARLADPDVPLDPGALAA